MNNNLKVKICGIKRIEDLKACENLGTDFIGFINVERSKRYLDITEIAKLVFNMDNKDKSVLVIEPKDVKEAEEKIKQSGIKTIQLHSLSPDEIRHIKCRHPVKIIRALGVSNTINPQKIREIEEFAEVCDYILFDYEIQGKTGGTGKQIPLLVAVRAAKIAINSKTKIKLFLAGCMDARRMGDEGEIIVKAFDYIDVNSGVEDEPGIKNPHKIKGIMEKSKELNKIKIT